MRLLSALLMTGCWGYPTLVVTAQGDVFSFARCGAPDKAPPLQSIRVTPTDGQGHPLDPPVCRLALRPGAGTAPVRSWSYGSPLPTLVPTSCAPLIPGAQYRIEIVGGGAGAATFTAGQGGLVVQGGSCR